MSPDKAKQCVQTLLVDQSVGVERLKEAYRELESAEISFDAAYDGLFSKTQAVVKERDSLKASVKNHEYSLFFTMKDIRLVGLHA